MLCFANDCAASEEKRSGCIWPMLVDGRETSLKEGILEAFGQWPFMILLLPRALCQAFSITKLMHQLMCSTAVKPWFWYCAHVI